MKLMKKSAFEINVIEIETTVIKSNDILKMAFGFMLCRVFFKQYFI